ncbi:MAG: hypothetical protein B6U88_02425 [Candidatus Aenigmarchaeota archaeon ex4484_56]|nr:MAG: hypothetical protein B6U88_02425 [Candidatus Aenigmarchaeota archaeon ex4484_56]
MIVEFLGGCNEIGREAFLIKDLKNVLLEFGVKLQPEIELPIMPSVTLDSIIVTHAHLDHCGMVPLIYKTQTPRLYVTPPTLDLMNLLLEDYIKVAKLTRGFSEYNHRDIEKMNKNAKVFPYNHKIKLKKMSACFYDASHIPGSASIFIEGSKKIMYTGDINTVETKLLDYKNIKYPKIDCLITESTYSNREHPDRKKEEKKFIEKIKEYENGLVLLPCFAIGRAQEILLILEEYGIKGEIYLDGMAQKAADLILYHKKYIKNPHLLKKILRKIKFVRTKRQRDKIVREGGIVVSTSGMLNGGPAVYYLKKIRNNKNACVLLTGFQAEGTPGEKLLRTNYFENEETKFKVNLEVKKFDFSAHAGKDELFDLIKRISPKKVICVHGENTKKFSREIRNNLNIETIAPRIGDNIEI